jgi:DNA polymerase-3 subunit epsilon
MQQHQRRARTITREGNPEGHLCGEVVVFTGALKIPRRQAADLAAAAGCSVQQNVTQKTTLLVVGDQDIFRLSGHGKSIKHRKAEQLINSGRKIRIITETDFRQLIDYTQANVGMQKLIATVPEIARI